MIYLDNAATTQPYNHLSKYGSLAISDDWFNPSSLYTPAVKVSQKIKEARKTIADCIKFNPSNIIFTSGATEGNNMVMSQPWRVCFHTPIEHKSVSVSAGAFCYNERIIPVDITGRVILSDLDSMLYDEVTADGRREIPDSLNDSPYLVSIIAANNEIGTIQPIDEITEICHKYNVVLHLDCTQAMGKIYLNYKAADIITASAHKFHGFKGVGFIASKVDLNNYILGGAQESGMRAGTENTMGILSMADALKTSYDNLKKNFDHVHTYKTELIKGLKEIPDVRFNSEMYDKSIDVLDQESTYNPYILSVSFKNVNAESLLYLLSLKKIYVSSGSACNSKEQAVSPILRQIKVPDEYIYGTIRFSFSHMNDLGEVSQVVDAVKDCVASIRHSRGVDV